MNERANQPSPEDRDFSSLDSSGEAKKDKIHGKSGGLKRAAKIGAVVMGAALAGAASAEGAQGTESHHEQHETTWSAIINLVRTDMHRALDSGASRKEVEQYIQEVFAIMREGKKQGKRPDTVQVEVDSLWTKTFKSPGKEKSFDDAVAEMGKGFNEFTEGMNTDFESAKADMADDLETRKAEMDSAFQAIADSFQAGDSETEKPDLSGSGSENEQPKLELIHAETLPANFDFSPEWMQVNVGKTFLQGDKVLVVADGESLDMQTASDKAGLEADAMIADYVAQEGAPKSGSYITLRGSQEATRKIFQVGGKFRVFMVKQAPLAVNLGK